MRRRLSTLLSALSLLLCVATAALWVRSYFYHDRGPIPVWTTHARGYYSLRGKMEVTWQSQRVNREPVKAVHWPFWKDPTASGIELVNPKFVRWQIAGFSYSKWDFPPDVQGRGIVVPYWFPTALLLLMPTYWALRRMPLD